MFTLEVMETSMEMYHQFNPLKIGPRTDQNLNNQSYRNCQPKISDDNRDNQIQKKRKP